MAVFGITSESARTFLGHLGATLPGLVGLNLISPRAEFAAAHWAAIWLFQANIGNNVRIELFSGNMDVVSTADGGTVAGPLLHCTLRSFSG